MNSKATHPEAGGFQVQFRRQGERLHAHVTGTSSLENTVGYWQRIVREVRKTAPRHLLLLDELRGPGLRPEQWRALVLALHGTGLEKLRIAHVKPFGLEGIEHCEIHARELGFDARAFDNESAASLWLRYGAT